MSTMNLSGENKVTIFGKTGFLKRKSLSGEGEGGSGSGISLEIFTIIFSDFNSLFVGNFFSET